MTMMMNARRAAAALALLALPAPAFAAGNGQLDATSEASFKVDLNIAPPIGTRVQIIGLDDFNFGEIATSATGNTPIPQQSKFFCLNRSDAGSVQVTISQPGVGLGDNYRLAGAGGANIALRILVGTPDFGLGEALPSTSFLLPQSVLGCDANSGIGVAHGLIVGPADVAGNNTIPRSGLFTGTFTVRLAVPS